MSGVSAVSPSYLPGLYGASSAGAGTSASQFASVAAGVDALQAAQSNTNALAVAAVTGDLDDVHNYTIAAAQSATQLELTAALRNKAIEAFHEIMRMNA
ncbi:MAG: flagellar hook-basal body complex protein FliE [Micrococcales bacterium]|nr:flagellar hook-basal body complex protein FliE [Micrococcales bacterium]MCL2667253.1 flagellar hook-basal body complex protein FliE [Micrococcales bacterium]